MDSDLRQYQQKTALSAIAHRYSLKKKAAPLTVKSINCKKNSKSLFDLDSGDEDVATIPKSLEELESEEDEELALTIQASLDQSRSPLQWQAPSSTPSPHKLSQESLGSVGNPNDQRPSPEVEIFAPSGLETFLTFAGTGATRESISRPVSGTLERNKDVFEAPSSLLTSSKTTLNAVPAVEDKGTRGGEFVQSIEQPVSPTIPALTVTSGLETLTESEDEMEEVEVPMICTLAEKTPEVSAEVRRPESSSVLPSGESKDDEKLEEVGVSVPESALHSGELTISSRRPTQDSPRKSAPSPPPDIHKIIPDPVSVDVPVASNPTQVIGTPTSAPITLEKQVKTPLFSRPRLPSPSGSQQMTHGFGRSEAGTFILRSDAVLRETGIEGELAEDIDEQLEGKHWDAAEEMDLHAEEGEFARFLSQVKGRNLNDVRREIDDEIKILNEQKKAAMRDSGDITQQMVSQIMVRSG